MKIVKNKSILITGGTGSFGNAVLKKFFNQMLRRFVFLVEMKKNKTICVIIIIMTNLNFL